MNIKLCSCEENKGRKSYVEKKSVVFRFFTMIFKCIKRDPLLFVLSMMTVFLDVINGTLLLLLPKYLLLFLNRQYMKSFITCIVAFGGTRLLISILILKVTPCISKRKEHLNAIVIDDFLQKSKEIKLEKFEEPGFYNLYLLTFNKCCDIFQNTIDITINIVQSLFTIIVTLAILSWINPLVIGSMFCFILLQTFISGKIKKINYDFNKRVVEHNKRLNYIYKLFYIPEYLKDIRINSIFEFIFLKKDKEANEVIDLTFSSQNSIAHWSIISAIFSFCEMIIINGYLGYMVFKGLIWINMFVTSQSSYSQLETSVGNILDTYTQIYENDLYVKDYLKYMAAETEGMAQGIDIQAEDIRTISFQNVSFVYPNTNTYALQDVSFTVRCGEKVLIVGENGAGKTTILKLLLRLYDPCSGCIKINDIEIKEYSIVALRQVFSTLLQDSVTYAFSIRENLCFGENVDPETVQEVIRKVELQNKIDGLDKKVETPISSQLDDGGIELSAGEKQKLILARNLLKKNKIYIFDEPSSNLDAITEKNILLPILNERQNLLIMISHNLKYVELADKIICLECGKISEEGTKEKLLKKKTGGFFKLYNASLDNF